MSSLSFLESEFPPQAPENAFFHILPVPYEHSVSYGGGTAQGPEAILHASQQLEAWDGFSTPGNLGFYTAPPLDCHGTPEDVLTRIEQAVQKTRQHHACPILLGGEHTVTLGALRALTQENIPFGIIQIDAHADLRAAYEGNPFSHASVMYRAVHDLGIPLAQFANRDFSKEEVTHRKQYHVHSVDAHILAGKGMPEKILPEDFPQKLYISFDVDGLDASMMPATGTPSPGGLFWYDTLILLERCCKGREVIAFDVVELAPIAHLPSCNFTAAKLVHALMGITQRSLMRATTTQ